MGASKHVTVLLTLALTSILRAGQDQPTPSSQAAPAGPSNTKSASCIVRIAVDPDVLPLSPETVSSLIHSPAVLGKALREVLSVNTVEDFLHPNSQLPSAGHEPLTIRWLNTSSAQEPAVNLSRTPGESDVAYRTRVAQVRNAQQMMKSRGMGISGGAVPSATIELQVHLPDTVPALADELLQGVVKSLQDSLSQAYRSYQEGLAGTLAGAKEQYQMVESEMEGREGDVTRVRQQLETLVDLSQLNSQTPLGEALNLLRKSVEPPLNIVVLWKDMARELSIEPTSPVNIDGMPKIRLRTALDLLVKGLRAADLQARWKIQDDTIVIGTPAVLGRTQGGAGQPHLENDARNLAGERSELARRIQALELDLAGLDARREAIVAQIAETDKQVRAKLADDPVTQELEKLAKLHAQRLRTPDGRIVTPESESAIRARIELATRREDLRKQAGGAQLEDFNKELSRLAIDKAEKDAQLQIVRRQFDQVQKQLLQALAFDPEATRLRLAQESLDIAARRVTEVQTRLANLQPPLVTVLGAN